MAQGVQVEIERKYDVDGQASLPRLNGVGAVAQVRYRPPVAMEALYFDTPGRQLAANRVTLRRRIGGPDEGWHVKVKSGEHRIELHSPLTKADRPGHGDGSGTGAVPAAGAVEVPPRILDVVQVHVRGRHLVPVARLNTLRSVVDLMDGHGRRLAEVCDDQVAAMAVGFRAESRVQHWREWEVEVIDADLLDSALQPQQVAAGDDVAGEAEAEAEASPTTVGASGAQGTVPAPQETVSGTVRFLDAVGMVLENSGARPSGTASKLEKLLGTVEDPLDPGTVEAPGEAAMDLQTVLTKTVRTQVRLLKGWDPLVRRDVEDSIHQFRVVCRTLRSLLQTYAPLLEPEATSQVNKALRKLGRLLSTARDAEVVRDQAHDKVGALPGGADGPVAELVPRRTVKRLRRVKADEFTAAHDVLLERMRTPEYFEVLDRLDAYAQRVPLAPASQSDQTVEGGSIDGTDTTVTTVTTHDAVSALEPLAAEQVEAILTFARAAAEEDPEQRIEMMHEVRKEAKRLRYAVKAVQDATGLDWGQHFVTRMKTAKKLQEALGQHRDSIMFQEHVRKTAKRAAQSGEDTFGYGVLFAAEFSLQEQAEATAKKLLGRLAGES